MKISFHGALHSLSFTDALYPLSQLRKREATILLIALSALCCFAVSYLIFRTWGNQRGHIIDSESMKHPPLPAINHPQTSGHLQVSEMDIQQEISSKLEDAADEAPQKEEIKAKTPDSLQTEPESKEIPAEKSKSSLLPNGDEWRSGNIPGSGPGIVRTRKGEILEGEFIDGKLHGKGISTSPGGEIKTGTFEHGVFKEGKISYRYPKRNGSKTYHNIQEGLFENGLLNGRGCSVEYGVIREGIFRKGLLNGNGKMIFEDDMVYQGLFFSGKFSVGNISFRGQREKGCDPVVDPRIFQEILIALESMNVDSKLLTSWERKIEGNPISLLYKQRIYVYETLKGFAKLNENMDEFENILKEQGLPAIFRVPKLPEFAFHIENRETLLGTVEYTLRIFSQQYLHHKANGTLESFLKEAFDQTQACFEARSDYLLNYHHDHPTEEI